MGLIKYRIPALVQSSQIGMLILDYFISVMSVRRHVMVSDFENRRQGVVFYAANVEVTNDKHFDRLLTSF